MNQKVHVACNFNILVEIEGLLKVTGSHIHCKCGTFSQLVQDRDIVSFSHCRPLIGNDMWPIR